MSFILKWLRPDTSSKINLRPHKDLTLQKPYEEAYSDVLRAIELILGANIYIDDKKGRTIEAGFGLVNNERIRVSFDTPNETTTNIRIEALFRAGAAVPETSHAVDALAAALTPNQSPST
jgi:hypothetical protein